MFFEGFSLFVGEICYNICFLFFILIWPDPEPQPLPQMQQPQPERARPKKRRGNNVHCQEMKRETVPGISGTDARKEACHSGPPKESIDVEKPVKQDGNLMSYTQMNHRNPSWIKWLAHSQDMLDCLEVGLELMEWENQICKSAYLQGPSTT